MIYGSMKLHWNMPPLVRTHFLAKIQASEAARKVLDLRLEWHHLERPCPWPALAS
jgi:hypothetical protein